MKSATFLSTLVVTALIGGVSLNAVAKDKAKLEAKAKISKAAAEKIALAKVPGGKVKEAELEEEDGVLVWSFDCTKPGTKDVTEVLVDAKTGKIVSVENESPEKEAKEARQQKEKDDDKDKD